ncbi:MAG: hypothetical protein ACI4SY_01800 [Sutterella sp.]
MRNRCLKTFTAGKGCHNLINLIVAARETAEADLAAAKEVRRKAAAARQVWMEELLQTRDREGERQAEKARIEAEPRESICSADGTPRGRLEKMLARLEADQRLAEASIARFELQLHEPHFDRAAVEGYMRQKELEAARAKSAASDVRFKLAETEPRYQRALAARLDEHMLVRDHRFADMLEADAPDVSWAEEKLREAEARAASQPWAAVRKATVTFVFSGEDRIGRPIEPIRISVKFIWDDAKTGTMPGDQDWLSDPALRRPIAVCDPCRAGDPLWRDTFARIREAWEAAPVPAVPTYRGRTLNRVTRSGTGG